MSLHKQDSSWLQQEGLELRPGPLGICYGTEARELHLNSEGWVLPSKLLCRCIISLTAAGGARAETWPPQVLLWDRGWKAPTHWLRMCTCLRKTLNRWNSSLITAAGVRAETVLAEAPAGQRPESSSHWDRKVLVSQQVSVQAG